jgi:poly(A) polymerase
LRFFGYSDQAWTDAAIRRYVRDAGEQLVRLHILTRSDVTTRNKRKGEQLSHAYDDLEKRIAIVMEQEELNAMRPDLTGEEIMEILNLKPGPKVGKAYKYLLELRIENGPLGPEAAKKALLEWHSKG